MNDENNMKNGSITVLLILGVLIIGAIAFVVFSSHSGKNINPLEDGQSAKDAQVEKLEEVGVSDEVDDIEGYLDDTDIDSIDKDLSEVDKNLGEL
jgi:flagellar basal body-associated protein FliL